MASQPTSIFLLNNHLAFIYSLSFCQENQFDVTDLAFLDFFGIVVFEDLEIAWFDNEYCVHGVWRRRFVHILH